MKSILIVGIVLIAMLAFSETGHAASITYNLDPFTGDSAAAEITVDDDTAGFFSVSVQVLPETNTGNIGDITGIFFNLSDEITESDITVTTGGSIIDFENNTQNLGEGVNLNGGGSDNPGSFDVGLQFSGFSVDDIQLVEFTIDLSDFDTLTLDDFDGFGLRLQSVGVDGSDRNGSSKMSVSSTVPEPATVVLLGIGILGLAGGEIRRRRKKKAVGNS